MHINDFINRLDNVKENGSGFLALCPSHVSKSGTRKLAITEGRNGQIVIKCWSGCSHLNIVDAMGLEEKDLFPEPEKVVYEQNKPKKVRRYYTKRALDDIDFKVWFCRIFLSDMGNKKPVSHSEAKTFNRYWKELMNDLGPLMESENIPFVIKIGVIINARKAVFNEVV